MLHSSLQHLQNPLQQPSSSLNAPAFMPGMHDAARPFPHTAVASLLRQATPSGEQLLAGFQTLAQQQEQQQLLQGAQKKFSVPVLLILYTEVMQRILHHGATAACLANLP